MRKTKRLIVRPLELHDYENWRQAHSMHRPPQNEWDETAWKDSELTLAKYKRYLRQMAERRRLDKHYSFGVFRRDDGILLGHVVFMDVSRNIFQNAYLGYGIFNNYWGQGYASEACRAGIEIGFKDLRLQGVKWVSCLYKQVSSPKQNSITRTGRVTRFRFLWCKQVHVTALTLTKIYCV